MARGWRRRKMTMLKRNEGGSTDERSEQVLVKKSRGASEKWRGRNPTSVMEAKQVNRLPGEKN